MARIIGETASVIQNTNRVISASNSDWSAIRVGSYFRMRGDRAYYNVLKTQQLFYIKDFVAKEEDTRYIVIEGDLGHNILMGDKATISYKEYEFFTLINIEDGGKGYKIDDVISPIGGSFIINKESGEKQIAELIVSQVDENGKILALGPKSSGKYYNPPSNICKMEGGKGKGAILDLKFKLLEDRAMIEREVMEITRDKNSTVFLDFPLPKGIKSGKLSIKKWEIFLTAPYLGESKVDTHFELCRDFSPNYGFAFTSPNMIQSDILMNKNLMRIDKILCQFEARITELGEKINSPIKEIDKKDL